MCCSPGDFFRATVVGPALATLAAAGVDHEGIVQHDHPAKTLAGIARERAVTQIVIGNQGQSGLSSTLTSVSRTILSNLRPRLSWSSPRPQSQKHHQETMN